MPKEDYIKDTHCRLEYQRFMDLEERISNKGQNAFCLVRDTGCPYYLSIKNNDYCTFSKRSKNEEDNKKL